ncbi:MAG: hypothetical protein V4710_23030 [Verrucomicrobiota bacterium]
MATRLGGLVCIVFGILLTLGILWLVQTVHFFTDKLIIIGPVICSLGLGLAIFGKAMTHGEEENNFTFIGGTFAVLGVVAGYFLLQAVESGDFRLLEKSREIVAEQTGQRERILTGEEVEQAIRALHARAAELQEIRAALDPGDAVAMKKFEADAAAYNQRNREVGEMSAKFKAQLTSENAFQAKLMGTWKYAFTESKGFTKKTEISGMATYRPDKSVEVEAVVANGRRRYHPAWKGHWELEGDKFRVTVDSVNKDCAEKPGDIKEFRILEVTGAEFRYRDLRDGSEMVRYRVPM